MGNSSKKKGINQFMGYTFFNILII